MSSDLIDDGRRPGKPIDGTDATFCVILLVYNDLPHAQRAVDSVLAQTDPDFQLVIVDNGSTDSTHRLTQRYARDTRVRIVRMVTNQRSDAAQVIAETTGCKYVSFLFADDSYHPSRLAQARSALDTNPDAKYVFFNNRFVDDDGGRLESVPVTLFAGDISSMDRFGHLQRFLFQGNTLHPCGMVLEAAVYKELKGFPKTMHRLGDLTFFTRLLGAYDGVFSPERMQTITVWRRGRNESTRNYVTNNQVIFERVVMLDCWLEPGILDNLEKIFAKRQTAYLRLRSRAERLWFLAHQVMSMGLPDYQMFGYRLLYQAAADADDEFEEWLIRLTGKTVSEYVTALSHVAKVDFSLSFRDIDHGELPVAWRFVGRLSPGVELEVGKFLGTVGAKSLGSAIYDDAIARKALLLRRKAAGAS